MDYIEMARLQKATQPTPLTAPMARQLAEYWARQIRRLRDVPYLSGSMDIDPVWPQELARAQALAMRLSTMDEATLNASLADVWNGVARLAIELERWRNHSTVAKEAPGFEPNAFRWPGKPIIAGATSVQGGWDWLLWLALLWLLSKRSR